MQFSSRLTSVLPVLILLCASAMAATPPDQEGFLRLLHYDRTALGRVESQVDGPDFFLAPNGKTDPAAEWRADSLALYDTALVGDARFACRYPARARWMRGHIPNAPFPESGECAALETFKSTLAADSVALVFASSYINSPPSAFGHVYLKLLRRNPHGTAGLSDYTVGFGAQMEGAGPLKVVVAGFAGTFRGYYNVIPFDASVRKYSHHDNREQWVFPLGFEREETERLVEHLWELRHTWILYSFLSENCAYHLATLLEGARFDLDLNRSPITTPLGLLHEVQSTGLIRGERELPSMRRTLAFRMDALSGEERDGLNALVRSEFRPSTVEALPDTARARVLDLGALYMDYRYGTRWILDSTLHARKLEMLEMRAALPESPEIRIPAGTAPTRSHKAGRVETGVRMMRQSDAGLYLAAMPALQGLTDDITGLGETSEFKVLEAVGAWVPTTGRAHFERLTLLDLFNFQPSNRLLRDVSWKGLLAVENGSVLGNYQTPEAGPLNVIVEMGLGKSISESARNRWIGTVLATGGARWLFAPGIVDPFAGLFATTVWNASDRIRLATEAEARWYARADAERNVALTAQFNVRPDYGIVTRLGGRDPDPARWQGAVAAVIHW